MSSIFGLFGVAVQGSLKTVFPDCAWGFDRFSIADVSVVSLVSLVAVVADSNLGNDW